MVCLLRMLYDKHIKSEAPNIKRKEDKEMKKNFKKVAVRVAGIVGLAVICMTAYYGVCMFLLQNGAQRITPMFGGAVGSICVCIVLLAERKKNANDVAGTNA